MKKRAVLFSIALAGYFCATQAHAQLAIPFENYLLPTSPTSADNISLSMRRVCGGYKANAYNVKMAQNNITVTRNEVLPFIGPGGGCSSDTVPRVEIDIGRLPAGNYTLSVTDAAAGNSPSAEPISNFSFTVSDARLVKTAPFVRLDYSGHWWDPSDPGWGLFIWHGARDQLLAAWFVYGTDGKPIWYTFQPTWETFAATTVAPLAQTTRMPGATIPPPNPTSYAAVGTASLDFTIYGVTPPYSDVGKFTYTFTGGATTIRNIQRFKGF